MPNSTVRTALLRSTSRLIGRWWFDAAPDWDRVRRREAAGTRFARAPRGVRVTAGELGGRPAEILTPAGAPADAAVLYLHGGGFTMGTPQMLRPITGLLAATMGTTVYALDYRLAPEHVYPAAIDDAVAAYRALLERGIPAERIAVAGDSAGGDLTIEVGLRVRDAQLPAPAVLGAICPVLDFSDGSAAFDCDPSREPLLSPEVIAQFTDAYLPGVTQERRREISPAYRDITGLPPIVLHSATDDPLAGDARRFADRAAKTGAPLRHSEYRGLWHVFHALPMPQAREAVRDLAGMLAERIYGRSGYRATA
ncbi:alpha/beta hydrolase [Nocardia sp. NPDC005978]|uniref:alpha/beta hydrolase n=1 Tax=Nocardia sp. NPDC005978 TaxID=3156725 RepID=UPI0033AE18B1